jgi:hypothetical protein
MGILSLNLLLFMPVWKIASLNGTAHAMLFITAMLAEIIFLQSLMNMRLNWIITAGGHMKGHMVMSGCPECPIAPGSLITMVAGYGIL